jgi:hypothetical protein
VSSSAALRSSSLHRRFLVLFAGGTDGDESWTVVGGDVVRCAGGGDVYAGSSV